MTLDELVDRARRGVARLAQLDRRFAVAGSGRHRHRLLPPHDEAALADCEGRHEFCLPPELRAFYTGVARGGAGPGQGLCVLDLDLPPAGLGRPFRPPSPAGDGPYRVAAADEGPGTATDASRDGALLLAEQGPGVALLLVLNGPATGQIWWHLEGGDRHPVTDAEGHPLGFAAWYLGWLDGHLARFEALVELLGARTAHDELHALTAGRWPAPEVDRTLLSLLDEPLEDPAADRAGVEDCARAEAASRRWLARRRL